MQYQRAENGWEELKSKNVDFGSGLERLAMAVNNLNDIFESDLFSPIIKKIEELSKLEYGDRSDADYIADDKKCWVDVRKQIRIIADHIKAATFVLADDVGIAPSNTKQGYVIRRLIRRAIRYGKRLGINKELWLKELANEVKEIYKDTYPELERNFKFVCNELDKEQEKFEKTLENGLKEFEKITGNISGEQSFNLYQTYGFPIEIIIELAKEKGFSVDEKEFNEALRKHQELSRTSSAGMFKGGLADASEKTTKLHTVTHLLLASLRQILGPEVFQKGSNITAERLRFDFSFPRKLTEKELRDVENLVNEKISENLPVTVEEVSLEKAKEMGAMGIFNERYGTKVKIYFIGRLGEKPFSLEICGGPHVKTTGELGKFRIIKEEASSRGVRRIKANAD
jgi:alanyl-tRNA synthetase